MTEKKIHTDKNSLLKSIEKLKSQGKKIVFTNGCFDILHVGHISYLQRAKTLGDVLVIALNSDASVKKIKGVTRPLNSEMDRAVVIAALECVDLVTVFSESTPEKIIAEILPDVLVKGGDWAVDQIVGAKIVKENGGEVHSLSFLDGYSTTSILEKAGSESFKKSFKQKGSELEGLIEKVASGDLRNLGRLLTYIDTDESFRGSILSICKEKGFPKSESVFGISGPPGSGKSSLLAEVSEALCSAGKKVGVIAVDPSSVVTGGAFLGDRVRSQTSFPSEKLFFRSLASKGQSGGISAGVESSVALLQVAGFEIILIETIGGGQSDIDISSITKNIFLVQSPVLGDTIQMMKSGLNEFASAFIVNKADLSGAKEFSEELEMHLEESGHGDIPVFLCSALKQEGLSQINEWILKKL